MVARKTNLSPTIVQTIFDEHVQIKRKPLSETICIDEFYFSRKAENKYSCLFINFKNGMVIDVLPSRKKADLRSYFGNIPQHEREIVKYVSMDLYDNYEGMILSISFSPKWGTDKKLDQERINHVYNLRKKKAIRLYIKYGLKIIPTIRELGYPSRKMLKKWYDDYKKIIKYLLITRENPDIQKIREKAVNFYLTHGKNIVYTVRKLGYPSRSVLSNWICEEVKNHQYGILKKI